MTVALAIMCAVMSWYQPDAFASADNFFNITRNFAFIGIMAIGMTAVILTGGIDLSVGSLMGLVGVVCGLLLQAEQHWVVAVVAGLLTGAAAGAVNGVLHRLCGPARLRRDARHAVDRALARHRSLREQDDLRVRPLGRNLQCNRRRYHLRDRQPGLDACRSLRSYSASSSISPRWGNYLYSIGGNENAARLTGVPVRRIKLQAYVVSGLTAALASVLIVGWQGSAINALGQGYELRVIASTVIGGADLMGGQGGAFGAVVGAALIEVIRNSLLMAGVDSNWQGAFVGLFIVLAVLLQRIRGKRSA